MNSEEFLVVFLHIPKTGGHSFRQLAVEAFGEQSIFDANTLNEVTRFIQLPENEQRAYRCIFGHMPYGLHEYIQPPCKYFTVLRDPVDRFISDYFYILDNTEHPLHKIIAEQGVTLKDYALDPPNPIVINTLATRLARYELLKNENGVCWWGIKSYEGDELISSALSTLGEDNLVSALFEEMGKAFEAFEGLIQSKTTGMNPHKNVTPYRLRVDEVDPDTLNIIRRANAIDVKLYEYFIQNSKELGLRPAQ